MSTARKQLVSRLWKLQDGKCCYCDREMTLQYAPATSTALSKAYPNTATIEHLRRKSEGGKTTPDNIAAACFACNINRQSMNWVEYKTIKSRASA